MGEFLEEYGDFIIDMVTAVVVLSAALKIFMGGGGFQTMMQAISNAAL